MTNATYLWLRHRRRATAHYDRRRQSGPCRANPLSNAEAATFRKAQSTVNLTSSATLAFSQPEIPPDACYTVCRISLAELTYMSRLALVIAQYGYPTHYRTFANFRL